MAHMNEGSIASDNDHSDFILYPIVEDGLYPHQFSQPQYNTSTGEIIYGPGSAASEVDYTAMLSGEDSVLEDIHTSSSTQSIKQVPFYSTSTATYQSSGFCVPNVESYDFHSSFNIPRTIGIFTTSAGQESTQATSLEEHPRFLIQDPVVPIGYQVGSHPEITDYRSTPSTSPATSIGGFEGIGSGATHSTVNSTGGSPYNTDEDWGTGAVTSAVDNLDQEPGYCSFVDPSTLTNSPPQQPLAEDPASSTNSPHHSPTLPHLPSSPSSPTISRKKATGRVSPFSSGRSHPTFPYPPPRRDSIKSNSSSRGSKSPALENCDDAIRMHPPSSPTGQQPPVGRDTVCAECGKSFRDMRAHLLTHKLERPEKCPIATCEYSKKGFARKYDCQRHTLTHYKGTMVCGFCPCAGSPAEKSFNRADVFKRHLMSVHNVEQTPPNGRKKSSTTTPSNNSQAQPSPTSGTPADRFGEFQGTGKCSTCSGTFSTAQQFYEHLDDCVYSKVVQEEPGAAYNEINLSQVRLEDIADSLASNTWKGRRSKSSEREDKPGDEDEEEDDQGEPEEELEDKDEKDETWTLGRSASKHLLKSNGGGRTPSTRSKTAAATKIKRGVRYRVSKITGNSKPRARRGGKKGKNFPISWAYSPEQRNAKRRCLMVYDGPNILCKDEMMMNTEWEVRASTGGDNCISDLDFWTMQRANAALDAGSNFDL